MDHWWCGGSHSKSIICLCWRSALRRYSIRNVGYGLFTGDPTSQPTFITRTIASLPEHWSIRVRAKIYKIDAWAGDNLLVRVDGATVSSYSWSGTFGGGDICGTINPATGTSAYNDGYVLLDHNASHTSSTLSV